ncbi:MDR/zinc-dependent alcohol dehydrogenase-like family protein [Thalassoglobus polymorphus]|uniref:D-arabitol-phosphate dehydrogenase n=1 Tax=Thalassoglobus polymorphus TaxID=2527994 RepID=A0A517QJB9_9PLAN|nr:alcohol dehydrogenase catalytic domain-containing protein [Thalassoglobus polymorphus]QDT31726.1 D-arabitol-phosphate dehydrogenase [Thalassoglobus polymorphus]
MKATLLQDSQLLYEPNYEPVPIESAIEVEVLQAGICETDLQLIQGYMGFAGVLGHEFVGIAKSGKYQGQRVAGEINCACGDCECCAQSLPNHCPNRTVIGILNHDGAFAERVWVPEENLHPIPDSVSDDQAVFVEPLAAAFQIPAQLDLSDFQNVIVLGDGRLGNLCAQVLQGYKKSPLVIGKHPEKLERLAKLGIDTELLSEVSETRFSDLVVDCTGSPSGLTTAYRLIKPRGTIVLKSTYAGDHSPNLAPIVIDELNLVGSRCGPFPMAIEALAASEIDVDRLVTSRFPIEESIKAFQVAQQKDQLKVILKVKDNDSDTE